MTRRVPHLILAGLVLAVIPALLAVIVLLTERGARRAVENRDLHLVNLRTAFAAWCEHSGRLLGEELVAERERSRSPELLRPAGGVVPFRVGDGYLRYVCHYGGDLPAAWPRFDPFPLADWLYGPEREVTGTVVGQELSPWDDAGLAVARESFAAALAAGDVERARRVQAAITAVRTVLPGYGSLPADLRHGAERRALALRIRSPDDTAEDAAVDSGLLAIDAVPYYPSEGVFDCVQLDLLAAVDGEDGDPDRILLDWLRDGHTHLSSGLWDATANLAETLGVGPEPSALNAVRVRRGEVLALFDAIGRAYRAGERGGRVDKFHWEVAHHEQKRVETISDPERRISGTTTFLDKEYHKTFTVTRPAWLREWVAVHPCTVTLGERRIDISDHVMVKRTALDSVSEDLYLRVHRLAGSGEDEFIAGLRHAALDAVVRVDAAPAWLPVLALVALSLAGLGLLGWGVLRERHHAARRRAFVAEAAHELKTPAALIRLHADTLALERLPDPADRKRYLATIAAEADRLSNLVGKLLSFSRLEAGAAELAPADTDLAALVRRGVEGFALRAADAGIELGVTADPDPLPARVDATAIGQIVFNLLDNALKYGRGPVAVTLRRGESLELAVVDHGPGIPPARRTELRAPFTRGEAGRERGGTGLGLHLVERLAAAHGGGLELIDTPGGGLTAVVRLPRSGSRET